MDFMYDNNQVAGYLAKMTKKQYDKFDKTYSQSGMWQGKFTKSHVFLNVCRILNGDFTYLSVNRLKKIIILANDLHHKGVQKSL